MGLDTCRIRGIDDANRKSFRFDKRFSAIFQILRATLAVSSRVHRLRTSVPPLNAKTKTAVRGPERGKTAVNEKYGLALDGRHATCDGRFAKSVRRKQTESALFPRNRAVTLYTRPSGN